MSFENITKGAIKVTKFWSKRLIPAIIINIGGKKSIHLNYSEWINYPEEADADADAEFIYYCFNLQQKLDISCYEEVFTLLEMLYSSNGTIDITKSKQIKQVLTKAKRQ